MRLFKITQRINKSYDEVVNHGHNVANNLDYTRRRSLRSAESDIYFSGWMDCYDFLTNKTK